MTCAMAVPSTLPIGIREGRAHFVPAWKLKYSHPIFGGRMQVALDILGQEPPDVFNHNLETVPRLYREAPSRSQLPMVAAITARI